MQALAAISGFAVAEFVKHVFVVQNQVRAADLAMLDCQALQVHALRAITEQPGLYDRMIVVALKPNAVKRGGCLLPHFEPFKFKGV
jgi:hypothetical protein